MPRFDPNAPFSRYPIELTVAVAGTPVGADDTFPQAVTYVTVIADLDVFFAETSAKAAEAADGDLDDRSFAAAGERRVLPWGSAGFWVVNAVGGELPEVRVEGWI